MSLARSSRSIPAVGLGFALAFPGFVRAQVSGPPISSGSGSGLGTGMSSSSLGATGTGTESSTGLGTTGTGFSSPAALGNRGGFRGNPSGLTTPRDFDANGIVINNPNAGNRVTDQLFVDARLVTDPADRALAMVRIAQTAIFSKQLDEAEEALKEAAPAATAVPHGLVRRQRIVALIDTMLKLAEERVASTSNILIGTDDVRFPPPPVDARRPGNPSNALGSVTTNPANSPETNATTPGTPLPLPADDRSNRLRMALNDYAAAVEMAMSLNDDTARTEALFRIVESESFSSQRIITDPSRSSFGRPTPVYLSQEARSFADDLLASAARAAIMIDRPIWRYSATYSLVSNAAASSQFRRGFEVARGIDQPEARVNSLIRLAEGQAINNQPDEATAAYFEAARSVVLVPQDDIRETLIGVLIDSLISFGRFDDARACVPLYKVPARQLVALSAVAESQGRRGLADSARNWIGREVPPQYRPILYRKVNDGLLASIQQNRSKDLTRTGDIP